MAVQQYSTTAPVCALVAEASAAAEIKVATIKALTEKLADLMADLHGGSYRVLIDHEADAGFIMMRPDSLTPIIKPKRGEVA